jgi:hypothetical protein
MWYKRGCGRFLTSVILVLEQGLENNFFLTLYLIKASIFSTLPAFLRDIITIFLSLLNQRVAHEFGRKF